MRRKGRLCISRGLNHCEWREQSGGSAVVRSAAACVAVCVGEFVVAAHLALVRRVSRELGHERLLAHDAAVEPAALQHRVHEYVEEPLLASGRP